MPKKKYNPADYASFGMEAVGRKKDNGVLSGDLIDHACSRCGSIVTAPSDATRTYCGKCMQGASIGAFLLRFGKRT